VEDATGSRKHNLYRLNILTGAAVVGRKQSPVAAKVNHQRKVTGRQKKARVDYWEETLSSNREMEARVDQR